MVHWMKQDRRWLYLEPTVDLRASRINDGTSSIKRAAVIDAKAFIDFFFCKQRVIIKNIPTSASVLYMLRNDG